MGFTTSSRPIVFVLALSAAALNAQKVPDQAVFQKYCVVCHNQQTKQGDFAMEPILAKDVSQNAEAWEKVIRKMRARYMPPVGLPRPDDRTYNSVIAALESSL